MAQHAFQPILLDLLRHAQNSQNAFFQELPQAELEASGTPERWSAKDHVAHMTYWRRRLIMKLQAIIRQEPQPEPEDFEQMNSVIFEQQRHRPWADILAESDQAYDELIVLTEQLQEEDLTANHRFAWNNDGDPLYTAYMGNCYEHTQQHLAQYTQDRHDPARALQVYEDWVNRVVEVETPDTLKGYVLYNLACFYATHDRLDQAMTPLQQSLTLAPSLKAFARTDPDLEALRPNLPD